MRAYDLIEKKKLGLELTREEITFLSKGYLDGSIPDYQMSALLMAICFKGMTDGETAALTEEIVKSGDVINLDRYGELSVDKHSTGGVGDKTTPIIAPILASLGAKVAKMSGRGLGHTGGTVDKLEAFEGYNTALTREAFEKQVDEIGIAVVGQTGNLAPLDKKLYALRDVTATVSSIPLIASSVMGKKLAAGAHSIVLDVKYGKGAFVKSKEEAELLAEKMVAIGKLRKRRVSALITSMDEPLGYAVGNALEMKEAIEVLRGNGRADITEVSVALASEMASLSLGISHKEAKERVEKSIKSGQALAKFKEWIGAQGGDTEVIEDGGFKLSPLCKEVKAEKDGYIAHLDAEKIGIVSVTLGAGRSTKDEKIDLGAGIVILKKVADRVSQGDCVALLYSASEEGLKKAEELYLGAISYTDERPSKEELIYKTIR